MSTTVYRVEDRYGGGPYRGSLATDRAIIDMGMAHADEEHPSPSRDRGLEVYLYDEPEWVCGFASEAELTKWFDGWLDKLHEVGFEMSTYEVPDHDVRHGDKQVLFRKGKRICREQLPNLLLAA